LAEGKKNSIFCILTNGREKASEMNIRGGRRTGEEKKNPLLLVTSECGRGATGG